MTPKVAVVGAGLAGLSCARHLQQAGWRVVLFDKSRGLGGRMSTRRGPDWQCDHGAQYFTARDPAFQAEVQRWCDAGVASPWEMRIAPRAGVSEPLRYVGVPRMSAPARWLSADLAVHCGHTLKALALDSAGWRLAFAEETAVSEVFDHVVLAMPAPQAAALLAEVAPTMAALAAGAKMQGCWALMLQYHKPLALPFDAAFIAHAPLSWVARDRAKPGRSGLESWLLHAAPDWSEQHLDQPAEWVAEHMMAAFLAIGGELPDQWSAHRWRYAHTVAATEDGCAWSADLQLGVCGDWLAGGRVEGAWLSGRALALRMLQSAA